jgi:hypothetical protein
LTCINTLDEVVQVAAAFAIVQGAFNWIADSYGHLAEWRSSANRVASLLLALDQIDGKSPATGIDPSSWPHETLKERKGPRPHYPAFVASQMR